MAEAESGASSAFAAELRAHRAQRGWTQAALGGKIGFSGSFVSDVERGERFASLDFAQACDREFGTPGTFARMHEIARRAAYPAWFSPVVDYERSATRIQAWELGAIPGLLQNEDYARCLITATKPQDTTEAIERLVVARLERQDILSGDNSPRLWYVLDESVARRVVGSASVMAGQLERLISVAREPGTVIQILPFGAGDHAGTDGPVTVYEFADRPAVGYAEANGGGRIAEETSDVAEMVTTLDALRACALSPRATLDMLVKIRSDFHELAETD